MKQIFLLISLLFTASIGWAQSDENKISPYLFEKFMPADVMFKDGSRYKETMNYNLLTNKFCFLEKTNNKVQEVTNPEDILNVKINGRVFYQENNHAIEVLPTNPPIFVQYKVHIRKQADKGGYGSTSETTAVRTYAGVNADGMRYDFNPEALIVGKRYQHYWLEKNGKRKSFRNFKQFVKLYPEHKVELEQFIKTNQLYIDNVEHVKALCVYAESL